MNFKLIDYSITYFNIIAKKPIPEKRRGKFVQIINNSNSTEYLVLSPKELSVYHANIVERFCMLNGKIPGSYNVKKDFFEIYDDDWEVIGGGVWAIDDVKKTLVFGGASTAYNKFDATGLAGKVRDLKLFSDYALSIK